MKFKFLAIIGIASILYCCDDSTTGIGDFLANTDEINGYSMTFHATTRTIKYTDINENGVYSRTSTAYLGKFTDVDFGTFSADFITQINCVEDFSFPETMEAIESTTLGLFYASYYGDSLAPMRVRIDTLSKAIDDWGTDMSLYYTSYDPSDYYDVNAGPLAIKDYTAYDNVVGDSLYEETGYYSVIIDLPQSFSDMLYDRYMEDPDNYKDAYSFIHNVLKGFYVHNTYGEGNVLYIGDIWMDMTVRYLTESSSGEVDSTVYTVIPFAATKEVYMSTRLENDEALDSFVEDGNYTYLKTPAGLCTEVTLPLQEMYDALDGDTLNSITISFTKMRYASENSADNPYKMGTPEYLLMMRKSEVNDFFEQNEIYDSQTSFLSSYDSSTSSYSFSQLNRLVSQIFNEMKTQPEPEEGWDASNALVLIPVEVETDSQGNIVGLSHDLEVNSARLIGGEDGETLDVEVIYTIPAVSDK